MFLFDDAKLRRFPAVSKKFLRFFSKLYGQSPDLWTNRGNPSKTCPKRVLTRCLTHSDLLARSNIPRKMARARLRSLPMLSSMTTRALILQHVGLILSSLILMPRKRNSRLVDSLARNRYNRLIFSHTEEGRFSCYNERTVPL